MVTLIAVTKENLEAFKTVRLKALADTPEAFGSTYARESQFTREEWLSRIERWNGVRSIGYLAMDADQPCGIAGALLDDDPPNAGLDLPGLELRKPHPAAASLVSMWTGPAHRQRGVGRLLVGAVLDWARLRGVQTVRLTVVSTNKNAIDFYHRLGFAMTGRTEPYPNNAALVEYEMARRV